MTRYRLWGCWCRNYNWRGIRKVSKAGKIPDYWIVSSCKANSLKLSPRNQLFLSLNWFQVRIGWSLCFQVWGLDELHPTDAAFWLLWPVLRICQRLSWHQETRWQSKMLNHWGNSPPIIWYCKNFLHLIVALHQFSYEDSTVESSHHQT